MKRSKRVLACILAVMLVIGLFPLSASAAGEKASVTISVGSFKCDPGANLKTMLKAVSGYDDEAEGADRAAVLNALYTPIAEKGTQKNPYEVSAGAPLRSRIGYVLCCQ